MTAFKNCRVCDELVYIPSNGKHSHKCPGMNLHQAVQRIAQLEAENARLKSNVERACVLLEKAAIGEDGEMGECKNGFHFVDVTSPGYEGALNLFIGDYPLALVGNKAVAEIVRWNVQHIAQLEVENTELRSAMREIYEVWAGSDGFMPATAPEAYLSKLISEIVDIARTHIHTPPQEPAC